MVLIFEQEDFRAGDGQYNHQTHQRNIWNPVISKLLDQSPIVGSTWRTAFILMTVAEAAGLVC